MKKPPLPLLLAAVLAAGPAFAGGYVLPGKWEQRTMHSLDGRTWRPGTFSQGCLSQRQADQWVEHVRAQIAQAGCTASTLKVANGSINAAISCPTINQPRVRVVGTYSDTEYSADLVTDAVAGGHPVRAFARWRGRLIGMCDPER